MLVNDEATGLPVSYLACGGAPPRLVRATMVREQTVNGRAFARQLFRERHLNRWLAGEDE